MVSVFSLMDFFPRAQLRAALQGVRRTVYDITLLKHFRSHGVLGVSSRLTLPQLLPSVPQHRCSLYSSPVDCLPMDCYGLPMDGLLREAGPCCPAQKGVLWFSLHLTLCL